MDTKNEGGEMSAAELVSRLERHPAMRRRMVRILDVLEDTAGDVTRADDAERRAIEELRVMGQEILTGWGQEQARKGERRLGASGEVVRRSKKNCTGSAPLAKSP